MRGFFSDRFATLGSFFQTQRFTFADLKNLFSWSYWAETYLNPDSPDYLVTIIFLVVVIALLVFWRRKLKRAQTEAPVYASSINQIANIIAFIIIVTFSYIFFRAESINYLSSRLVILAAGLVVVLWLVYLTYLHQRILPAKRREYLERERFFRYIPKGKKNSLPNKK